MIATWATQTRQRRAARVLALRWIFALATTAKWIGRLTMLRACWTELVALPLQYSEKVGQTCWNHGGAAGLHRAGPTLLFAIPQAVGPGMSRMVYWSGETLRPLVAPWVCWNRLAVSLRPWADHAQPEL